MQNKYFCKQANTNNRLKYLAMAKKSIKIARDSMGKSIDDPETAGSFAPQMWPNKC